VTVLTEPAAGTVLDHEPGAPPGPRARLDISRTDLPPRLRPEAQLGVLDISEFFGETTGGVRTYLLQKARYVQRHPALRQVLVVPGARDSIQEAGGVRCYRLHGPSVPSQKPYRFMLATRSTSRIVAHERPDLIEVGSAWCAPWLVHLATRSIDLPAVWFYHSNFPRVIAPWPASAGPLRRGASEFAWAYVRRLGRMVRATLAPSAFVAGELERAGVDRVTRVSLGVDLDRFHPGRRASAWETRRELGLPSGPLAIFVGRLAAEKELDLLLAAWPDVERRTGLRLVIVGDGPARRRLRALPGSDRHRWLPFERDRERLADLLAAVDLYVAPCSIETFGLSALEALACGTPILSADRGGVAETVVRSGAGALFASGDREALVSAAEGLLGQNLALLGQRGRCYAETHHGWDRVLTQLFDVYRSILGV
jgi:alpha-1,6-mannosyltransferase